MGRCGVDLPAPAVRQARQLRHGLGYIIGKVIAMTRRDFLETTALGLPATGLALGASGLSGQNLPGTEPLTWEGDLSERMMDGAHRFVERKIAESVSTRGRRWHRDLSSRAAYEQSVEANRTRLRTIIGVVDTRQPAAMERVAANSDAALVAQTAAFRVHQVRWPVLEDICGDGLWFEPVGQPVGCVVALPDADQTPEQIAGLAPGIPSRISLHAVSPPTDSRLSCPL